MTQQEELSGWDAVIVAGGSSRRMGGGDKLALDVAGRTMLDRVLDCVTNAQRVIVVGPERPLAREVVWCQEEPPGGGPAAALKAALDYTRSERLVLLAGDQPLVNTGTVQRLLGALVDDGAVAVDEEGQPQWLCSAWRCAALRAARLEHDGSLRGAMAELRWTAVEVDAAEVIDCDTPSDLRRARELAR